jgi:hypothetical protein
MDVERFLQTMNGNQVAYLLIGGMNFLLRHEPMLTFDSVTCKRGAGIMELTELLRQEEEKRGRHWDAAERWRVIQQTISWAEGQATVQRNTLEACLREQRRKLAQLGRSEPTRMTAAKADRQKK